MPYWLTTNIFRSAKLFSPRTTTVLTRGAAPFLLFSLNFYFIKNNYATRAGILEALIKRGFVNRIKKNLMPTEKGKNLIAVLPNVLTSAKMTSEWEHKLLLVQKNELDGVAFMDGIAAFIKSIILSNNASKPEFAALFPDTKKSNNPDLGQCPRCGFPIREGQKGFFCDKSDCGFKLWKASKFWTAKKMPLTAAIVTALLKDGRVVLKGLYSEKTGKKYDATVILDDSGNGYVNFRLDFNATYNISK